MRTNNDRVFSSSSLHDYITMYRIRFSLYNFPYKQPYSYSKCEFRNMLKIDSSIEKSQYE